MIENYYIRSATVDRIRASWIAPAIQQNVGPSSNDMNPIDVQIRCSLNHLRCTHGRLFSCLVDRGKLAQTPLRSPPPTHPRDP